MCDDGVPEGCVGIVVVDGMELLIALLRPCGLGVCPLAVVANALQDVCLTAFGAVGGTAYESGYLIVVLRCECGAIEGGEQEKACGIVDGCRIEETLCMCDYAVAMVVIVCDGVGTDECGESACKDDGTAFGDIRSGAYDGFSIACLFCCLTLVDGVIDGMVVSEVGVQSLQIAVAECCGVVVACLGTVLDNLEIAVLQSSKWYGGCRDDIEDDVAVFGSIARDGCCLKSCVGSCEYSYLITFDDILNVCRGSDDVVVDVGYLLELCDDVGIYVRMVWLCALDEGQEVVVVKFASVAELKLEELVL